MENFARHQDQMRGYMEQTFGRFFPLTQFEDMARQNMALFQRAASMFRPAQAGDEEQLSEPTPQVSFGRPAMPVAADSSGGLDHEMRELKERMESLQRQLDGLQKSQKT
jgi:polyhydroxyalkanoate synthesis regulator protein